MVDFVMDGHILYTADIQKSSINPPPLIHHALF